MMDRWMLIRKVRRATSRNEQDLRLYLPREFECDQSAETVTEEGKWFIQAGLNGLSQSFNERIDLMDRRFIMP